MSVQVADGVADRGLLAQAYTTHHELGLKVFGTVVFVHWVEHIFQVVQIWALGWPRPDAGGAFGLAQPWLVRSELLHYLFALFMIAGFFLFLRGFTGASRGWWMTALVLQFWHHIEHVVLLAQAQSGYLLFGSDVPTSLLQLWVPRAELHLAYNVLVTVPMLVAIYLHLHPRREADRSVACSCARAWPGRHAAGEAAAY